jgi:hypothetical protein
VTLVTAALREQVSGKRWQNNAGFGTLCLYNRGNGLDNFFESLSGSHHHLSCQVVFAVAFVRKGSGPIKLFETNRAISKHVEHKGNGTFGFFFHN